MWGSTARNLGAAPPAGRRSRCRHGRLGDWKLNIGAPGSGVPNLMRRLLEANRVVPEALTLSVQSPPRRRWWRCWPARSTRWLFASRPNRRLVQMLLQTPGVKLFDFPQAEAYSRRYPFLSAVMMPRGVVDLADRRRPTSA